MGAVAGVASRGGASRQAVEADVRLDRTGAASMAGCECVRASCVAAVSLDPGIVALDVERTSASGSVGMRVRNGECAVYFRGDGRTGNESGRVRSERLEEFCWGGKADKTALIAGGFMTTAG